MYQRSKFPLHFKQSVVYKWPYPKKNCNQFYIYESERGLGNKVKEHSRHATSTLGVYCESNIHPKPGISYFKVIIKTTSSCKGSQVRHPHQDQQPNTQ